MMVLLDAVEAGFTDADNDGEMMALMAQELMLTEK